MKKRILALVCAMTMVLAMSLSVCAAGSSSAAGVAKQPAKTLINADDNVFGQVLDTDSFEYFANDTKIDGATVTAIGEAEANILLQYARAKWGKNFFVAAMFDQTGKTGTIEATCSNILAGQNVVVLHQLPGYVVEEIIPSTVADHKLVYTVNSNSPFGFFVITGNASSPKTGEIIAMICALAVVSGFGAAACAKKAKND